MVMKKRLEMGLRKKSGNCPHSLINTVKQANITQVFKISLWFYI